jgi:plastocyanin
MTRTTQTTKITLAGVAGLSALVVLLSGCAGTQSQMPPSGEPTTGPTDSSMPGMDHDMDAMGDFDVEAISIKFMPETITIEAGTTLRWVNSETITHTITSGAFTDVDPDTGIRGDEQPDGLFDVTLAPKGDDGDTFEFTYDEPGTYQYYCDIHLGMNAVVIVE